MERNNRDLDELLKDESVRGLVGALPEDEPSMAWRSELNEKLLSLQAKPRARWWASWRPMAGLAVAGALALTLLVRSPQADPNPQVTGLDEVLIAAHRESAARQEIGAASVSSLRSDTGSGPAYYDEVDLSTL
jgi:hypothetical protein